jgi:hypothetical protein
MKNTNLFCQARAQTVMSLLEPRPSYQYWKPGTEHPLLLHCDTVVPGAFFAPVSRPEEQHHEHRVQLAASQQQAIAEDVDEHEGDAAPDDDEQPSEERVNQDQEETSEGGELTSEEQLDERDFKDELDTDEDEDTDDVDAELDDFECELDTDEDEDDFDDELDENEDDFDGELEEDKEVDDFEDDLDGESAGDVTEQQLTASGDDSDVESNIYWDAIEDAEFWTSSQTHNNVPVVCVA